MRKAHRGSDIAFRAAGTDAGMQTEALERYDRISKSAESSAASTGYGRWCNAVFVSIVRCEMKGFLGILPSRELCTAESSTVACCDGSGVH